MEQRHYYRAFVVYKQDPRHAARLSSFFNSIADPARPELVAMRGIWHNINGALYLILYQPFWRVNEKKGATAL
jgi:hypothetical protein